MSYQHIDGDTYGAYLWRLSVVRGERRVREGVLSHSNTKRKREGRGEEMVGEIAWKWIVRREEIQELDVLEGKLERVSRGREGNYAKYYNVL